MNKALSLLTATGMGAGLMYIMDPDIGRRRRALARNKVTRGWHKAGDAIDATSRDVSNRAYGLFARASSAFCKDEVSDQVLEERIRSRMGRYISHPGAVRVSARDGHVTLEGDILSREVQRLLTVVENVRGVESVDNRLTVHQSAENVPVLQGHFERTGERFQLLQSTWSPTARLMVGLTGGALAAYGFRHGGALGGAVGTVGIGMIARGLMHDQPSNGSISETGQKTNQRAEGPVDLNQWNRHETRVPESVVEEPVTESAE